MNRYCKIIISSIFSLFILASVFMLGVYIGEKQIPAIEKISGILNKEKSKSIKFNQGEEIDFNLFWESWKLLEDNFVYKDRINYQTMLYGAIEGLAKSLNDPHTVFMTPPEVKRFQEDVSGSFNGIGAEIGIRKNQLLIIAPLKDTPAEKAGLRPKDVILKIGDKSTNDLILEEAVSLIRGPKDTEVTLLIYRDSFDKPKEFKIKRDIIKIPVIKLEIKDEVAIMAIYSFNQELIPEFRAATQNILKTGVNKLVIDLRNNPGGFLEVAQDISSYFLPWGKVITIEEFSNGKKDYFKSRGYNKFDKFKIVVLVNSGSASASEILAGALRDNLGVKLIGEKTYGKGSVQELKDLKDGSSIKVTIASWLTPNEHKINDTGLEPDIKVETTEEDIENNKDPQLEKAIEVVRGL